MFTAKPLKWFGAICLLALLCGGIWLLASRDVEHKSARPKIALLSSIDLRWGGGSIGDIASGNSQPDPLVGRLAEFGELRFVDTVAQMQAENVDVAILLQPRALSPDEFVRLDKWVRAGGRLLLFADPALQWPSDLPIGDPQRPLFTTLLSPLFDHWGVELSLPMDEENLSVEATLQGRSVVFVSPGIWDIPESTKSRAGRCRVGSNPQIAECRPGKGQAILVADADLLHASQWQSSLPGIDSTQNIEWTGAAIDALVRGEAFVRN